MVKPERVALRNAAGAADAMERILWTRLREARVLAKSLHSRDKRALHDFRIACKRLRYALDRVESPAPWVAAAGERLAQLQDVLGEAHDRDVLLEILPPTMGRTHRRLQSEREGYVDQAAALWKGACDLVGGGDSHRIQSPS